MERQPKDLINEMTREAMKFTSIGIAVGFESTTNFVWDYDEKKLETLERLIEDGGEPIGLIAYIVSDIPGSTHANLRFHSRVFAEYTGESWAADYLKGIGEETRQRALTIDGDNLIVSEPKIEPEWIN